MPPVHLIPYRAAGFGRRYTEALGRASDPHAHLCTPCAMSALGRKRTFADVRYRPRADRQKVRLAKFLGRCWTAAMSAGAPIVQVGRLCEAQERYTPRLAPSIPERWI